jgi:hypothetical protein
LSALLLFCISGDVSVHALDRVSSNSSKLLLNVDGLLELKEELNEEEHSVSASRKLFRKGGKAAKAGGKDGKSKAGGKDGKAVGGKDGKTKAGGGKDGKTKAGGKDGQKDTKKSKKDTKKSKKDTKKSKKDTKKSKKSKKDQKKKLIPSTTVTTPQVTSQGTSTPTTGTGTTATPTVTATPTGTSTGTNCPLQSASNIVVLGSSTVTSAGPTVLNGDVVTPTITGFPPGIINGVQHTNDAVASQAQTDLTAAITSLNAPACDVDPQAAELGGSTLPPGVYCFAAGAQITGTLTLDAQGNPNAQWIFRIPSTLTTADAASIVLSNGALACNIFFVVGSSATLGGTNDFNGNILASSSVSLKDLTIVNGNLYANTGGVTLLSNTVTSPTECGC